MAPVAGFHSSPVSQFRINSPRLTSRLWPGLLFLSFDWFASCVLSGPMRLGVGCPCIGNNIFLLQKCSFGIFGMLLALTHKSTYVSFVPVLAENVFIVSVGLSLLIYHCCR